MRDWLIGVPALFPFVGVVTYFIPLLICEGVGCLRLKYNCPSSRHRTRSEHLFFVDISSLGLFPG